MHKLFSLKIESSPSEVTERLSKNKYFEGPTKGIYDLEITDNGISGFFWHREEVIVLNESDIHSSAEPITFFKVSRFLFKLRHISKKNHLLQIESSSKSVKPFLKTLQELTESKIFISQIDIELEKFSSKIIDLNLPLTTITHAYASNQTISASEKITFSLYSSSNAIEASQALLKKESINFDRIRIQTSEHGKAIIIDIKSNCLYNISEPNSTIEKHFIDHVVSTQYDN